MDGWINKRELSMAFYHHILPLNTIYSVLKTAALYMHIMVVFKSFSLIALCSYLAMLYLLICWISSNRIFNFHV